MVERFQQQVRDAYRLFAHWMPAAQAPEEAKRQMLRVQVSTAFEAGEPLAGKDLTGADLHGLALAGIDLSGAFLEGADLREADLSGANLQDVVGRLVGQRREQRAETEAVETKVFGLTVGRNSAPIRLDNLPRDHDFASLAIVTLTY